MTEPLFPLASEASQFQTNQATAKKALKLLSKHQDYAGKLSTNFSQKFRNKLAAAFALDGKIVYGKAFDAIGYEGELFLESLSVEQLHSVLKEITVYEVKSTNRELVGFKNFFFSISTAEILVAQSLKHQFKFILVNTTNEQVEELTLQQVYGRAESIYPGWSIRFRK